MISNIFILVPSPHPTGPIKGAVALANSLVKLRPTNLIVLKPGPGMDANLDPSVKYHSLENYKGIVSKIKAYRRLLRNAGSRNKAVSISFCLSADVVNLMSRREAVTCSSIRGNLPQNYRFEYGWTGLMVAAVHLFCLRWFDHVVAMSASMAMQISKYAGIRPQIVGNFVDETFLKGIRPVRQIQNGPFRFVFVGSLTVRKQVGLLLSAAAQLKKQKVPFHIDIIGDGNLRDDLLKKSTELGVDDAVFFHGYVPQPFEITARADCMVLPSLSEGVSRAVLEALYLGVPCLLRDADGHKEIITHGQNGFLFSDDDELAQYMLHTAKWSRNALQEGKSLLPNAYRQTRASQQYLSLIESKM